MRPAPSFVLLLLLLAPVGTGCFGPSCENYAAYSVNVTVADDGGAGVDDAEVTYTVDGGNESDCESFGEGDYACGVEESGEITVYVVAAGFEEAQQTVEVDADRCHVIPEAMDFDLVPAQ
jgi:hypothetical protein